MNLLNEHDARRSIIKFGKLCYERHLLVAMDGNLSIRLPNKDILITKAGCHKGLLEDSDILLVDKNGKVKRGDGKPTSEVFMHLACYDQRPDINAVIHAHPPLCVAFTLAGVSMEHHILPEVVLTLGSIPTASYETTGSKALAEQIGHYALENDAILMDTHGAISLGRDMLEAFCRLETVEHTALIMKTAMDLGGLRRLPPDEAMKLRKLGLTRYGGPPAVISAMLGGEEHAEKPRMVRVSFAPLKGLDQILKELEVKRAKGPEPKPSNHEDLVVEEVLREIARKT